MPPDRPLLTIAIPTYNRSAFLGQLLGILMPQLKKEPSVELLISDNASPDDTAEVVDRFCGNDPRIRLLRNTVNVGADENFLQCFREARGKYLWLVGDDDILVAGSVEKVARLLGIAEYDLAFVRPYAFREKYDEVKVRDYLGRAAMVVNDPERFAEMTGVMLTFISAVIVNKDRLAGSAAPDPSRLIGTNLIQLGWVLPLLAEYRRGLIIYGGLVAGRRANSGGYDHSNVFGRNLKRVAFELLPGHSYLAERILNNTLRCWFPDVVLELRRESAGAFDYKDMDASLRPVFGDNPRYWFFVYPAIKAPLWLASLFSSIHRRIIMKGRAILLALIQITLQRRNLITERSQ